MQIGLTHPLGRVADVLLGGGRCAFIPQSEKDSCRFDDKDLIKTAKEEFGWNVVEMPEALKSASQLPLLGLFAPEDFAAPLDRPPSQPSLEAMVDKAIELLSAATKDSDKHKGFFLFYESEVTDTTGHNNDAIATYSAALEINDATLKVKDWYGKLKARGEDTLFFSLSDHETGGFGIGYDVEDPPTEVEYGWEREPLCQDIACRHIIQSDALSTSSPGHWSCCALTCLRCRLGSRGSWIGQCIYRADQDSCFRQSQAPELYGGRGKR